MNNEELLEQLESSANFMRGMCFDPRIPNDTKEALQERAQAIDEVVQKHLDTSGGGRSKVQNLLPSDTTPHLTYKKISRFS